MRHGDRDAGPELAAWLRRSASLTAAVAWAVLATAAPAAAGMDDPPRKKPLDDTELMAFLDTAVHVRALERNCPDLFDKTQKEQIYLAYRWGRSVSTTDAYPVQLFLTVQQTQTEHMRALKGAACGSTRIRDMAKSFNAFLSDVPSKVRLSEIK